MKRSVIYQLVTFSFIILIISCKSVKLDVINTNLNEIVASEWLQSLEIVSRYYQQQTNNIAAFTISDKKGFKITHSKDKYKLSSFPILTGLEDSSWKNIAIFENGNLEKYFYLVCLESKTYPDYINDISNIQIFQVNLVTKSIESVKSADFKWSIFNNPILSKNPKVIPIKIEFKNSENLFIPFVIPAVEVDAKTQEFFNGL
jgi:hypothetical protein